MKGLIAAVLIIWLGVCRAFASPIVKVGSDNLKSSSRTATVARTESASATDKADYSSRTRHKMDTFLVDAQNAIAPYEPACFYCKTDAGEATVPPVCSRTYANLYSKPVVDFRITLGYSDWKTRVEDQPYRAALVDRLLFHCEQDQVGTCGFKRDPDDADVFTKTVNGPDDKPHTVRLRLVNSSVGVDDEENRGPLKSVQDAQTKRAEENFFGGLSGADVVIYAGHARKGGGASFSPPIRPGANSAIYAGVNYHAKEYRDKSSEEHMIEVLKANPHPPKFIGIFACAASDYFAGNVRSATKNRSGVAASGGVTPSEVGMAQAFAALDSLLAERCQKEFGKSLRAIRSWAGEVAKPPTFIGFFGDALKDAGVDPLAPLPPKPGENAIVPRQDRTGTSVDLMNGRLIHPAGGDQSADPAPAAPARPAVSAPSAR